jgi:hypothetical protein
MDDFGQDYGYSDTTEEIPSWMGGNRDMETGEFYPGLNEANSGTNFESMAGYTFKDGVWTSPQGLTYDTKTNTGSLADLFKTGGIGSVLGIAGAAGLAQQLLGGGGGGYAGYQGGIPKYTAERRQYAVPLTSAPYTTKITDQQVKDFFSRPNMTEAIAARGMNEYNISPERVAGIFNLPAATIQSKYQEALGPNYAARRPGSGGVTYFSPMSYKKVVPPVVPADTTTTTTTPGSTATTVTPPANTVSENDKKVFAAGGIASLGGYSDGGQLLRGPGDGVSDSIPATIGKKQPARLADGEFVVPARIVSELGNGSTEAGARKLYAMMDRIKKTRQKAKNIAANTKADKHLPA